MSGVFPSHRRRPKRASGKAGRDNDRRRAAAEHQPLSLDSRREARLVPTVKAEGGSGSSFVRALRQRTVWRVWHILSETRLAVRVTSDWNAGNRPARPLIARMSPVAWPPR